MNLKQAPAERFGPIMAWIYRRCAAPALAPMHAAVADAVLRDAPRTTICAPADVVDVGTGTGDLLRLLARAERPFIAVGVDESLPMLRQARRGQSYFQCDLPHLLAGQGERLPLQDQCARLVVSLLSFHHWENPDAALAEVHRVLVPGGELWTFEPDPHFRRHDLQRGLRRLLGIWPPIFMLRRAFAVHGFSAVEYQTLVAPAVTRSPFARIVAVEPFLWLHRMVLRREAA